VDIPICLEAGSFSVTAVLDETFSKSYIVKLFRLREQPTIHVIHSKFKSGPSATDGTVVDSEIGNLYKEWKRLDEKRRTSQDILNKIKNMPVYIQKHASASNGANPIPNFRYDELANLKVDFFGYEEKKVLEISRNEENLVAILPDEYTTCSFQPRFDTKLVDVSYEEQQFMMLVDMGLKMPHQYLKRDASSMHSSRSQSAVDEDRSKMATAFTQIIAEITHGIKQVFCLVYPDETDDIIIHLPHRTLLDFDSIHFLHQRKVITDEVAHEEYMNVVGLKKAKISL
jgi:hypothetical protein